MTYTVKDHGTWSLYKPSTMPDWAEGMGIPVAYAKRDGDGVDWYEYRKTAFGAGSVLCTVLLDPSDGIETVKAVFRDASMLFPANHRLIEVEGFDPADDKPHNTFAWMVYDAKANALLPALPPKVVAVADYQFAGQAAAEGIISDQDALDWVTIGRTPQKLIDAVTASVTDAERRKRVILFLAGTTNFPRFHELTPLLAASFGKDTPAKVDAFFAAASKR